MIIQRKIWNWFKLEIWAIPWRIVLFLLVFLLCLAPILTTNSYVLRILVFACIFSIFGASWDLLAGYVGQLSLGHSAFFGVGAYTAALLNIHFHVPPLLAILCGAVMAVVAGLAIALPTMRLRGFYLSLVTLAFPVVLGGLIFLFPNFSGGELGIYGVQLLTNSPLKNYYITLVIMIISLVIMWKLTDTESRFIRTGIIFFAIREDEITARASGINTTLYKTLGFCFSGFFAGVAGALFAHSIRIAGPSTLDLTLSFDVILWAIFGGLTTIYGALIGTFLLYPLIEVMRFHPIGEEFRIIVKALILIVALLFMPHGITRWIRDHLENECPRCKIINLWTFKHCRACRAPMKDMKRGLEHGL